MKESDYMTYVFFDSATNEKELHHLVLKLGEANNRAATKSIVAKFNSQITIFQNNTNQPETYIQNKPTTGPAIKCFYCGKLAHYTTYCRQELNDERQLTRQPRHYTPNNERTNTPRNDAFYRRTGENQQKNNTPQNNYYHNKRTNNARPKCFNCNRIGHLTRTCREPSSLN